MYENYVFIPFFFLVPSSREPLVEESRLFGGGGYGRSSLSARATIEEPNFVSEVPLILEIKTSPKNSFSEN